MSGYICAVWFNPDRADVPTLPSIARSRPRFASGRNAARSRALVASAAAHAQGLGAAVMFLEVGDDNQPALALYGCLGFVRVATRKGYYGDRDALVLKAALPLSPNANIA